MNELIFWLVLAVVGLIAGAGLWAEYIRQLKQRDRPLGDEYWNVKR